jgi:hypothetical protein
VCLADRAIAVALRSEDLNPLQDTISRYIKPGHTHSVQIDIAGNDFAAEQFGGGDRQDAGTSSDIERLAKSASPRQAFECY